MAQWKKSGHTCPHCDQGTEVLVGTMGDHDGVCFAERCWRCGWVAGSDKEEGKPTSTKMAIKTNRGDVYSLKVVVPKGDPENPMTDDELKNKFRECAGLASGTPISPTAVDDVIDMLNSLEEVDDIREVTRVFSLA